MAPAKKFETIDEYIESFPENVQLVYFSAWKNHIGFYSIPVGDAAFRKELSPYSGEKGSLRFPMDKPIPYNLVKKIVLFRMREIQQKRK